MLKASKQKSPRGGFKDADSVEKLIDYLSYVSFCTSSLLCTSHDKLTLVNAILLAAPIEGEKTVLGNIVNLLDGCGKIKDLVKKGLYLWTKV